MNRGVTACACLTAWALLPVWPLAFPRASAGVLCSAVVARMAALSAHADLVISLEFVIDMLLVAFRAAAPLAASQR